MLGTVLSDDLQASKPCLESMIIPSKISLSSSYHFTDFASFSYATIIYWYVESRLTSRVSFFKSSKSSLGAMSCEKFFHLFILFATLFNPSFVGFVAMIHAPVLKIPVLPVSCPLPSALGTLSCFDYLDRFKS